MTAVRDTSVVLGLTLFLPFVVHVLPSWDDSPLGAHLLPIFYAPLGALLLGRFGVALAASFLAPWINMLVTGHPVPPMAALLCLQLVVFLIAGQAMVRRKLPGWTVGPAGYLVALLVSAALGSLFQILGQPLPLALPGLLPALIRSLPGMLILAGIGWWFSKQHPLGA